MNNFTLASDLFLRKQEKNFLSLKKVQLLENIMVYGSISQAAKASSITYKTAWDWIDKMNALAPKPLVQKISGGKGGGGTIVTVYAKELMKTYEEVDALHQKHLETLQKAFDHLGDAKEKTFSFSRLEAEIKKISIHENRANLELRLSYGACIHIQSPSSFVKVNALEVGSKSSVLIESEAVSVSRSLDKEISSRNKLKGRVDAITIDGEDVLLTLLLGEGQCLTSRITYKSYTEMQIKKGDELTAMFKAYNATLFYKAEK
jgi:molybdate transport system regulatory protein